MKKLTVIFIMVFILGCSSKDINILSGSSDAQYLEQHKSKSYQTSKCIMPGDMFEIYVDELYINKAFDWILTNSTDGDYDLLNGKATGLNELSIHTVIKTRSHGMMTTETISTNSIEYEDGSYKKVDPNYDEPLVYAGIYKSMDDIILEIKVIEDDENTTENLNKISGFVSDAINATRFAPFIEKRTQTAARSNRKQCNPDNQPKRFDIKPQNNSLSL